MKYQIINFPTGSVTFFDSFERFSQALVAEIAGTAKDVCLIDSPDDLQVCTVKFA